MSRGGPAALPTQPTGTGMRNVFEAVTYLFDPLHRFWDAPKTKRTLILIQIAAFLFGLAGIQCNRWGLLPESMAAVTPLNHFYAVKLAFTLVLIQEVVDLVFTLPCSVSKAAAKQFEILALILLRNSFKELTTFSEPIALGDKIEMIYPILADGAGALLIFFGLGLFYRMYESRTGRKSGTALYRFVAAKKLVSLTLLAAFCGIALHVGISGLTGGEAAPFFTTFYTVLIFSDILLVLISYLHLPSFHIVFRNSGFAVATLLIRLALAADPFYNTLLGVCAMAFALSLALASRYYEGA